MVATTAVLAYAAVAPTLERRRAAVTAMAVSGAALVAARVNGVGWSELGLDAANARRGARAGVEAALPVAAAMVGGAWHPSSRGIFADARVVGLTEREAAV